MTLQFEIGRHYCDHSTPEYTLAFLKIALGVGRRTLALDVAVGHSQYHLAVAGGYVVDTLRYKLRTHPLPQVVLTVSKFRAGSVRQAGLWRC